MMHQSHLTLLIINYVNSLIRIRLLKRCRDNVRNAEYHSASNVFNGYQLPPSYHLVSDSNN